MISRGIHVWKNIRVPGYDIKVKLHELLFMNTYTFQRLYHIKQLGLAYLVYPFATHTRAMHCLYCLYMAQRFVDSLKQNVNELSEDEKKNEFLRRLEEDNDLIRAGALLHDITHIPFAHTLEDENGILQRHDKNARIEKMMEKMEKELEELKVTQFRTFSFRDQDEFEEAIKKCKNLLKDVRKILWTIALHKEIDKQIETEKEIGTPSNERYNKVKKIIEKLETEKLKSKVEILEAERYYIADIIGNTISADLLSYVLMDPEISGTEEKPGGWYRLFDYLHLVRDDAGRIRLSIKLMKKGEWRVDVFSTIIRILNTRYEITELINYHHAKLSASAMLGKIAQFCDLSESDELYDIGDEGFFEFLKKRIESNKFKKIEGWEPKDIKESTSKLLENLRRRRLHKRFHVVTSRKSPKGYELSEKYKDPERRLKLEKTIIDKLGLKPGDIIVFCPERKASLKEAETLVTFEIMDINGLPKTRNLPLNSEECIEYLENEIGKNVAESIRNVENQYISLWKLYVFLDPTIIPIYGYEIKKILNEELGPSRAFDLSYLEYEKDYPISKMFSEEINKKVPEEMRDKVIRLLPRAVDLTTRGSKEARLEWLEKNVSSIVQGAIELVNNPQKRLFEE